MSKLVLFVTEEQVFIKFIKSTHYLQGFKKIFIDF